MLSYHKQTEQQQEQQRQDGDKTIINIKSVNKVLLCCPMHTVSHGMLNTLAKSGLLHNLS